jgi:hypothetical protein
MAFGLKAINTGGITQIDQNYQNYILIAEGTASTLQDIHYPATNAPLIMLGPTPNGLIYKTIYHRNDLSKVSIAGGTTAGAAASFSFQYRVYGRAGQHIAYSGGGFGLKVFADATTVAFHSDYKYLKVRQASVVTAPQVRSAPVTVSLPGTYAPFVAINGMEAAVGYWVDPDADYYSTFSLDVKTGGVVVREMDQGPAPFYHSKNDLSTARFTVLVGS